MNSQQQAVFDIATSVGSNVFITGPAGCGKSYLVRKIVRWAHENNKHIGVTASTGAAAILLGGLTIHSFLGIGLARASAKDLAGKTMRYGKHVAKRIARLEILIIDEISMIGDDLFDKISEYMQIIRKDPRPFGGVQMIVCGDFHQLPSIEGDMCFKSTEWARARLMKCALSINMRQSDDAEFRDILGRARIGRLTDADIERLMLLRNTEFPHGIRPTRLFSRRADVDRINSESFAECLKSNAAQGSKHTFSATYSCEEAMKWGTTQGIPVSIDICIGAQVVITWNLSLESGIINGTRGVVCGIRESIIDVKTRSGAVIPIERITVKDENNPKIWTSYYPLQLAYSLTFHKCQGMTLDAAEIDVGPSVFAFGQAYTALSRVKSMECLRITNITKRSFRAHPEVVEYYS